MGMAVREAKAILVVSWVVGRTVRRWIRGPKEIARRGRFPQQQDSKRALSSRTALDQEDDLLARSEQIESVPRSDVRVRQWRRETAAPHLTATFFATPVRHESLPDHTP